MGSWGAYWAHGGVNSCLSLRVVELMEDVLGSLGVGLLFVAGSLAQRWGVLGSLWPVRENACSISRLSDQ